MSLSRRRFLNTSLSSSTLVAMGASSIPTFLGRSAEAARASKSNERMLVVVQLLGGNDGLNTVIPHGIDGYNRGRRLLRISSGQIHKITPEIGLHPSMGAMAKLLENKRLSVVQGVGYPNPDRSHFRSMEIWESARLENDAKGARNRLAGPHPGCRDSQRQAGRRPAGPAHRQPIAAAGTPLEEDGSSVGREPRELQAPARGHRRRKTSRAGRAQQAGGDGSTWRRSAAGLHQPDDSLGLRIKRPARAARQERAGGFEVPELRPGETSRADRPDHQGGFRHADLLHVARRLRHARQPARNARCAPARALGFDRRLSRRSVRRRPRRPRRTR